MAPRCVDCRYTYCVANCPVECVWEIESPHRMLVIDPGVCIDCDACIPLCPVNAIWPHHELPAEYGEWLEFNAAHVAGAVHITEGKDPLPTARLIEEIQADERSRGWSVVEPSKAST